jgi:hypothetical protein
LERIRQLGKEPALLQAARAQAEEAKDAELLDVDPSTEQADVARVWALLGTTGKELAPAEGRRGRAKVLFGSEGADHPAPPARICRCARLPALALHFEKLLARGQVRDYADLARLGRVSRARISQIMNLLHLAPDLQEHLLLRVRSPRGRDPLHLARLLPITALPDWKAQRRRWRELPRRRRAVAWVGRFQAEEPRQITARRRRLVDLCRSWLATNGGNSHLFHFPVRDSAYG